MRNVILCENKKFNQVKYSSENYFEKRIKDNSKLLFGKDSVFLDLKNLVETRSLGGAVPDGFLFDFSDKENPEFYLVEVELEKHDFYRHIFPQLTKFFAFFINPYQLNDLTDTLYNHIRTNPDIQEQFKDNLGNKEIYKTLNDTLENSQNILVIIDEEKPEFKEMTSTYTDTWGRKLKVMTIKEFKHESQTIFFVSPDFEALSLGEIIEEEPEITTYTEEYHLTEVNENVKEIYKNIKEQLLSQYPDIKVNPQKYYISLREKRNFAFIKPRVTKMNIVVMTPVEEGREIIQNHTISELGEGVQKFYNGPCYRLTIDEVENMDEVYQAIIKAYESQ